MTADQPLALWPDEADVELPLDEATAGHRTTAAYAILEAALDDLIDHLEAGTTPPANRLRHYRTLAGRPAIVDEPATPEARRNEGIARAAAKWTDEEAADVDTAIRTIATRRLNHQPKTHLPVDVEAAREFTTADVWEELAGRVPVTKGIAGRMLAAKSAGIIANTGRTTYPPKDAPGPNNGQRLTVWRAL